MRKLVILAIVLTTASCASRPPVPALAQDVDLGNAKTETFEVGYSIDYGYSLFRSNDRHTQITPDFIDTQPKMEFDYGYGQLIDRPDIAGKRILCECRGVSYRIEGYEHFRVLGARIYVSD